MLAPERGQRQCVRVSDHRIGRGFQTIPMLLPPVTELAVFPGSQWKGFVETAQLAEERGGDSEVVGREERRRCRPAGGWRARRAGVVPVEVIDEQLARGGKHVVGQGVDGPSADHPIGPQLRLRVERRQPVRLRLAVVIGERQERGDGVHRADVSGARRPRVGLDDQPDRQAPLERRDRTLQRHIAAIVHDDYFEAIARVGLRRQRVQARVKPLRTIARRDDDGYVAGGRHALRLPSLLSEYRYAARLSNRPEPIRLPLRMTHLIVSREYPPSTYPRGGIGTYVAHMARLLAESGETVHVIGERWHGAPLAVDVETDGRLTVHRVSITEPIPGRRGADWILDREALDAMGRSECPAQAFGWQASLLTESLVDEASIDCIEAQEYEAPLYYFLLRRALGVGPRRQPPCFVHLHSPTQFICHHNDWNLGRPAHLTMKRLEDFVIQASDAVLCPSDYLARQAERHYGLEEGSIERIPLPRGDTPLIERTDDTWARGTICYVGRMEPRKGVAEWVDAAVSVARERPGLRFELIGSDTPLTGYGRHSTRAAAAARVPGDVKSSIAFLDAAPRSELWKRLALARLAVVPSRWENFPNTCVEAMATGLPVLASREGGMAEMVEDGRTGWLADSPRPEALAAALRRALDTDAATVARMGQAAGASVRRLCDNTATLDRHLRFRQTLVARGAGRSLRLRSQATSTTLDGPPPARREPPAIRERVAGLAVVVWGGTAGHDDDFVSSLVAQTLRPIAVLVGGNGFDADSRARLVRRCRNAGLPIIEPGPGDATGIQALLTAPSPPLGIAIVETGCRLRPGFVEAAAAALSSDPSVGVVSCWHSRGRPGLAIRPPPSRPLPVASRRRQPVRGFFRRGPERRRMDPGRAWDSDHYGPCRTHRPPERMDGRDLSGCPQRARRTSRCDARRPHPAGGHTRPVVAPPSPAGRVGRRRMRHVDAFPRAVSRRTGANAARHPADAAQRTGGAGAPRGERAAGCGGVGAGERATGAPLGDRSSASVMTAGEGATRVAGPPLVSVVICTRNRAAYLAAALESLGNQEGSPPFEVIVVDNGSTDNTREVVSRFESRVDLRCIQEPAVGVCHARNAGWRLARARYVAYLDDDAVACVSWVASVVGAFERRADAGVVGGPVEPIWQAPRPMWLADEVALGLTIINWPGGPKVLDDLRSEWLAGTNMAIRTELLPRVGGFHPDLDRRGSAMLSSGDVFLQKELVRLGHSCFYDPAMAVRHVVPASRLTKSWFRRRNYWQGVSDAIMELLEQRPSAGERLALAMRSAARLAARPGRLLTLFPTDDPARFAATCWTLIEIGHLVGLCGAARPGPPPAEPVVSAS